MSRDCCVCQLCPSTMAQGQEPGGHWGSRAAPSEHRHRSFSPMAFFQDNAPTGSPRASVSPGESWVRWGRGAESNGSLPARPSKKPGSEEASSLHGVLALTSILVQGGYPQCPAPLTGSQENRFGLWNFSSISLKESGIPPLRLFFFWTAENFSFHMNLPL